MDIYILKERIGNVDLFARRSGYGRIFDRRSNMSSYVRRLRGTHYPRFHLYIELKGDNYCFSLHLDQRETRYEGAKAHGADYDGPLIVQELHRINSLVLKK